MPRLTRCTPDEDQRGSVAILVAILMLVLVGLAAVAVEGGQMMTDKSRTQDAADAAAIAVAARCAAGDCGDISQTASGYAAGNGAQTAAVNVVGNSVTVTARRHNTYLLGAALGNPDGTVTSTANATWAPLVSATTAPFAVTECAWTSRTGADQTLPLDPDSSCPQGSFTYLRTDNDSCQINAAAGATVTPAAGSPCSLDKLADTTILVPVVNDTTVVGIAAFHLTGWCTTVSGYNTDGPCDTSNQQMRGQFVSYVALQAGETSNDAPSFGVVGVRLT